MSGDDLASVYREMDADVKRRKAERVTANLAVLRSSTVAFTYKPEIQTVLIREPGVPKVDFYVSVNQWKDCSTGRTVMGNAEALLMYLWKRSPKKGLKK